VKGQIKGRGARFNPPNRFERLRLEPLEIDWEGGEEEHRPETRYYKDTSRTILAKNDSPDVPFTYSLNPYRGCEHGCVYCYARPTHEYLGFSAGLDFETKIMVKEEAPALLDTALRSKRWKPQVISFSGNTDCYQPAEKKLRITRHCLEVMLRHRNPVGIITKNHLVTRDLDILKELASLHLVGVSISVTSLDPGLTRTMEPRTSAPHKRLETIETLAREGIPVGVNVAPLIPGLNDEEMPEILRQASQRGAGSAGYIMLRLPHSVKPLFLDWLQRTLPDRAPKIIGRIRGVRGGELSSSEWEKRMSGEGELANMIDRLFRIACATYRLNGGERELTTEHFRREAEGQLEIF
jgi:DNA repair photolyase